LPSAQPSSAVLELQANPFRRLRGESCYGAVQKQVDLFEWVFIDESGSFSGFQAGSISVLSKKYTKIRANLPKDNGEVKGKLLNEKQVDKVVTLLIRNEALFEITALDLGLHNENAKYSSRLGSALFAVGGAGHVPVVPCMPVVPDPVAAPVGAPDALLFGEELLICASAALGTASAKARTMSFMGLSFCRRRQPHPSRDVPKNPTHSSAR
jgi:hypothetical protein